MVSTKPMPTRLRKEQLTLVLVIEFMKLMDSVFGFASVLHQGRRVIVIESEA
jgi:hypothetical protein